MRRLKRGLFQIALENEEVARGETRPAADERPAGSEEPAARVAAEVPAGEPAAAERPAAERPAAEVTAAAGEVEVRVQVETEGSAEVVKTGEGERAAAEVPAEAAATDAERAAAAAPADAERAAVATEDDETAREAAAAEEAAREVAEAGAGEGGEAAERPAGEPEAAAAAEVPAERPAAEVPAEAAPEVRPVERPVARPSAAAERPAAGRTAADAIAAEPAAAAEEPAAREASVAAGEEVQVRNEAGQTVATVETTREGTTVATDEVQVRVSQDEAGRVAVDVKVDGDAAPVIAEEDLVVIETDGETADVEIQEAVDVAEDTAELVDEVDDAEEAAVALEALADVARSAAENGGLDIHGAQLLKIATENIYSHMGLGKAMGIPAMESFEVPGARVSATSIALEDISEQAKKIWEGIVAGIKQAIAWIQEFVQKIFTANGRIEARAKKILAAGEALKRPLEGDSVGDAKLARALTINGKIPGNLSAEIKKTVDFFAQTVDGKTAAGLKSVMDAIKGAAASDNAGKVEDTVRAAIQTIVGKGLGHKLSAGMGAKVGVAEAPAGTSISMSATFPGEQVVWAYMPETVEAITSFRSGVGVGASKIGDNTKLRPLNKAQIIEVAKAALAYVEAARGYDAIQEQVKALNALTSLSLSSGVAQGNADNKFKAILPALKAARHLIKGIHQPAGVVASRVVNASLTLAAASIPAHGAQSNYYRQREKWEDQDAERAAKKAATA